MNKNFKNIALRPLLALVAPVALASALGVSSPAMAAATIVIANNDAAGVGFNDTTAVTPVGGNSGTTLGQQRLIAFQAAAAKWGATLDSSVNITIRAQWTALTCTATTAVLGSAGTIQIFRDFPNAPFASTWYGGALANKIATADQNPAPTANNEEINANFNVNLGNPGCLDGSPFYLGLDANHGTAVDLVTVLTHEFAHGLGFQTFTSGTTGTQNGGFPAIYDRFLIDLGSGKSWLQMTDAERAASAINARKLAWDGPRVLADTPNVLSLGTPLMQINSPAGLAGSYDVGGASFGPALTAGGLTGNVVLAIDPNDVAGPSVNDACSPLTNAAAIAGKIALVDRGTCGFAVKAKNAQDAGAIGVIVADNVAGSPPAGLGGTDPTVVIPAVRITLADGNAVKAQLGTGVNVTLKLDMTVRAGADKLGKPLLFTPNPFQSGSSVSHWDTSTTPNQLMEPAINDDLTHEVTPPNDLTFSQMRDIGWLASVLPNTIVKTTGDSAYTDVNQTVAGTQSVTTTPAAAGLAVTWTVNAGGSGASAAFPSTTSRFAVTTTDASGVAVAPSLTANGQSGNYSMNATVPGAGTTTFAMANAPVPRAGAACYADTTQADFQNGVATNTDVSGSPGDVILLNPLLPDQQNTDVGTSGVGITATSWGGQTFTPAITGQLKLVDINLFCSGCTGSTPNLTVSVRATTAGLPSGADLATATIAGFSSGGGGYFSAVFASPATLTAGTMYAIVIRPTANPSAGTYALTRSGTAAVGTDVYAGGARVASANSGVAWTIPLSGTTTPSQNDTGFHTVMQQGNVPSGDFVSGVKDAHAAPSVSTVWSSLAWNANVPANTTLRFQVAASNNYTGPYNFVGPDTTAGTFFTSGASLAQFNGNRYLKYKAFFTTTNSAVTPTLADVTTCFDNGPGPDLTISKSHVGDFPSSFSGATYAVTVNNTGTGAKAAGEVVTVTDVPPPGISIISMAGSGWSCPTLPTCTRSDALATGAAYPPITVTIAVAAGATSPQVNVVNVTTAAAEISTANNSASDSTNITTVPTNPVSVTKAGSGSGTVTSAEGWINCGATCSATFANGSQVRLTATPVVGSAFTGWLGACTGNASVCQISPSAATNVTATFATAPVGARILDIDDNNAYDAATDGVLILRHLFGLTGTALSNNALGGGANPTRTGDPALHNYLVNVLPYFDVDGNGTVDALTDGLMILRKLLNLTDPAVITAGAIGPNATRSPSQIDAYIQSLRP